MVCLSVFCILCSVAFVGRSVIQGPFWGSDVEPSTRLYERPRYSADQVFRLSSFSAQCLFAGLIVGFLDIPTFS